MDKDEIYFNFIGKMKKAEEDFENRILEIVLESMKMGDKDNECTRHE